MSYLAGPFEQVKHGATQKANGGKQCSRRKQNA